MKRFITIQNIVYFKRLLEHELDPGQRTIVEQLLRQEEGVLASIAPRLISAEAAVAWQQVAELAIPD